MDHNFVLAKAAFFDSWQLSIINSIVYGIGTLPEAKIGSVKRMPKRGMDFCRLHALDLRIPDLLFCQPVTLVDQVVWSASCTSASRRSSRDGYWG